MTTIERDIEKYISDVNSHLLCSSKKKKEIIEDIRGAVLDFAENSGAENIEDVYKHFGTPEELAKAHLAELDPKQIKKKVNIRRIILLGVIAALAMIAFVLIYELVDSHREIRGIFSENISEYAIIHFTGTNNILKY